MNKSWIGVLLLATAFLGITGFSSKNGSNVGNYAHDISLVSSDTEKKINLKELRGSYTLLNFWNTSDANSRITEKNYRLAIGANEINDFHYVSVNTDRNERLAAEIAKLDKVDSPSFYRCSEKEGNIAKKFNLNTEMKSFLIDPNGEIISVNPTVDELREFGIL